MVLNLVDLTWYSLVFCRDFQNFISYHNRPISTPSSRDYKYHNVWAEGELFLADIVIQSKVTVEVLSYFSACKLKKVVYLLKLCYCNNICAYSDYPRL